MKNIDKLKRKEHAGNTSGISSWSIVFAVIAIAVVAAMAVMAKSQSEWRHDTERQQKAFEEVRAMGTAIQAFFVDYKLFPDTGHKAGDKFTFVDASALDGKKLNPAQKVPGLAPDYIVKVPATDPWGHPYRYGVSADNKEFILICSGSDGILQSAPFPKEPVASRCLEDDIIFHNDKFIQYPQGKQGFCK
jgi:hypothetical protein